MGPARRGLFRAGTLILHDGENAYIPGDRIDEHAGTGEHVAAIIQEPGQGKIFIRGEAACFLVEIADEIVDLVIRNAGRRGRNEERIFCDGARFVR